MFVAKYIQDYAVRRGTRLRVKITLLVSVPIVRLITIR